jgi:hypothetical protein
MALGNLGVTFEARYVFQIRFEPVSAVRRASSGRKMQVTITVVFVTVPL